MYAVLLENVSDKTKVSMHAHKLAETAKGAGKLMTSTDAEEFNNAMVGTGKFIQMLEWLRVEADKVNKTAHEMKEADTGDKLNEVKGRARTSRTLAEGAQTTANSALEAHKKSVQKVLDLAPKVP